jgi:para-aminobenzoate synthetase component I
MTGHRQTTGEISHSAPFWRLIEFFGTRSWIGLLDSSLVDGKLGRYSMLCAEADLVVSVTGLQQDKARVTTHPVGRPDDQPVTAENADPLQLIRQLMSDRAPVAVQPPPEDAPLAGGALLCLGYEAGHILEALPNTGDVDYELPDMVAIFSRITLCHCHHSGRTWLTVISTDDPQPEFDDLTRRIEAFRPAPIPRPPIDPVMPQLSGRLDQAAYERAVQTIKDAIDQGRVFEACMSQRLNAELHSDGWTLYQELRRINPAPFAAYLKLEGADVICSSPERFLSLDRRGVIESRPIKGTRPRGATPEQDQALHDDLAAALKDRAENLMIVDLVRNDIGRVAEYGSVEVPELAIIEKYATVWQMVSTIRGRLRADLDALDLIRACFPGGSMTGAPKIEAMRIIDELEPVRRQIYSGAIGYLDFRGNLDLNIVIRTCIARHGRCDFGVGGAVTADSDPAAEYQESLDKARALVEAVAAANARAGKR